MNKMYAVKTVASMFAVSDSTVRKWMKEKRIGHFRCAGTIRFTEEHIQQFREQTCVTISDEPGTNTMKSDGQSREAMVDPVASARKIRAWQKSA